VRPLLASASSLLFLLLPGCSFLGHVAGGPLVGGDAAPGAPPSYGGLVEAHAGLGLSDRGATNTLGVDESVQVKIARGSQSLALGAGFYLAQGRSSAVVYGRATPHLVFERAYDTFLVGGGAELEVGVMAAVSSREYRSPGLLLQEVRRERTLLTLSAAYQIDARFTRAVPFDFFALLVGVAWADDSVEAHLGR